MKRRKTEETRKHLPVGTGPHTVGCVDLMCDDGTHEHELFMRIYYPIPSLDIHKRHMQMPLWLPRKQYAKGYVYFLRKNAKIFERMFRWLGGDVYAPALWQAAPLKDKKLPVVIFSHGIGGNRTSYTTLCCELASQGFVVVAVEHRDGSASMTMRLKALSNNNIIKCDHGHMHRNYSFTEEWKKYERFDPDPEDHFEKRNRQVEHRVTECRKTLDLVEGLNRGEEIHNSLNLHFNFKHFKNLFDLSQVSMMGHSFGGATTIATLVEDPRFRVGVCIDAWVYPLDKEIYGRVRQPVLVLNYETLQDAPNIKSLMSLNTDHFEKPMITIMGTCHQSITDFQFMVNKIVGRICEVRYKLPPAECLQISANACLGFLWKHLGFTDKPQHEDILCGEHPYVIQGTNVKLT